MAKYLTYSEEETKKLAQNLAKKFKKGVLALTGDLGTGKTTFATGFAKGLGIKEKIISPTFMLIRQHQIPNSDKLFYHIDLYRIKDLTQLGLREITSNLDNIILIEWAEKAKHLLPTNTTFINLKVLDKNKREITLS